MKIAAIVPDDLSTVIFCKTLARLAREARLPRLHTFSEVGGHRQELEAIGTIHTHVPMSRYLDPAADMRYLLTLTRLLRAGRFTHVMTFTTKPNVYGVLAASLAGVRDITMAVRGLGRTFGEATTSKERVTRRIVLSLYRAACRRSTRVWFTSPHDRDFFLGHGFLASQRALLTTNGVDLEDFSPTSIDQERQRTLRSELGITEGDRVVIMVARLIRTKGVIEFAAASSRLGDRFPDAHFLLVAPSERNSPQAVSEGAIRGYERNTRFRWLGFRKDVRDLYGMADMAVLPSYYKEGGYPRALLEPMAMGKPVIAADTPDCRGPVEEGRNGLLCEPRSERSLARAIETLLANPRQRAEFGLRSRAIAEERFDDRAAFHRVLDALKDSPMGEQTT